MIRPNILEHGSIQVFTFFKDNGHKIVPDDINTGVEQAYHFDIMEINRNELIVGNVYLVYDKFNGNHYWSVLLSYHLEVFKELRFDENNECIGNGNTVSFPIYIENEIYEIINKYSIYTTLYNGQQRSFKGFIPLEYTIVRCRKYWKDYCNKLNKDSDEDSDSNEKYIPVKKISHMREITDLIGSFL